MGCTSLRLTIALLDRELSFAPTYPTDNALSILSTENRVVAREKSSSKLAHSAEVECFKSSKPGVSNEGVGFNSMRG
jgi:hypothetical protein